MNPKPLRPTPAVTVHIECQDYGGHRFRHIQEGHSWRCPVCYPTQTTPDDPKETK